MKKTTTGIQLVRHATLQLQYAGKKLLVDPMLADRETMPPITNTPNPRPNPLVKLPIPKEQLLTPDAVIVTHLHPDHWDAAASEALSKTIPLFAQPEDVSTLQGQGFGNVESFREVREFGALSWSPTEGRHGTGEIGKLMGPVSGLVLRADGEPSIYIAGDTIWCEEVRQALDEHKPDVVVVNAGGARFLEGDPITMDPDDVVKLCRYAPYAKIIAVHMDTMNHCVATRAVLRQRLQDEGLAGQVEIPEDGEWIGL